MTNEEIAKNALFNRKYCEIIFRKCLCAPLENRESVNVMDMQTWFSLVTDSVKEALEAKDKEIEELKRQRQIEEDEVHRLTSLMDERASGIKNLVAQNAELKADIKVALLNGQGVQTIDYDVLEFNKEEFEWLKRHVKCFKYLLKTNIDSRRDTEARIKKMEAVVEAASEMIKRKNQEIDAHAYYSKTCYEKKLEEALKDVDGVEK